MKKRPTTVFFATATLLAMAGSACFVSRPGNEAAKTEPNTETATPIVSPEPSPSDNKMAGGGASTPEKKSATIYHIVTNADGSHLEPMAVALSGATGDDAPVAAINAMAKVRNSPLPKGTQAHSVQIQGDVATVDLNQAFVDNFEPGDENEALAINSVTATLGQFPGVKRVQFLVEGKAIDSLGGNQSLDIPLPVPQTASASVASGHNSGGQ